MMPAKLDENIHLEQFGLPGDDGCYAIDRSKLIKPKVTMLQEFMQAVDIAIQDNVVGLTKELAERHLRFHMHVGTEYTLVVYKDKPILMFGFRTSYVPGMPETFIAVTNTVNANK